MNALVGPGMIIGAANGPEGAGISHQLTAPPVGSIPSHALILPLSALGRDAQKAFAANRLAPGIAVMDGTRLAGLLSRTRLRDVLTRPYGADLYLCRSLERIIDPDPLCIDAETPLDAAALEALARAEENLYEPMVVRHGQGHFSVLEMHALLRALADRLNEQNRVTGSLLDEVRQTAERLGRTLKELEMTQASLVESAKMASLGGLVAGVAHEVNTPVGIVLGAATHFAAATNAFRLLFLGAGLKRSDLEDYLDEAAEAMSLINMNAIRAGELIAGFKQVSADQASEERRRFLLASYLEEILATLRPKFKRRPIAVEISCPPDMECDTFPGALAQIVTNLMMNALIHAFDETQSGTIRIEAMAADDTIVLTFADDGQGIPAENQTRIFDPFFTTRRGSGGTGLGLNIVYNRVVTVLKGSVTVASTPGAGSCFTITFPRRYPDTGATITGSVP
jgi:two-component system, NtrC family, sensor kinase